MTNLVLLLSAGVLTACGGNGGEEAKGTNLISGLDTRPSNTTCLASTFEGSGGGTLAVRLRAQPPFNSLKVRTLSILW